MNASLLSLALVVGQPAPPLLPPAPFLFVHVKGPGATVVTWQPGTDVPAAAATVGLCPGYWHRFQLSNVPGAREVFLFPSLEVRGTLIPRPGMPDITKHPVPIEITENDIEAVLAGRFVTKVYYLEDPEKALALPGTAGEALEGMAASEDAAIDEARSHGRPLVILRIGGRAMSRNEVADENVPGTVLLPGARALPRPAARPQFPFSGAIMYDPVLGPKLAEEECLKDGGDVGPRLGVGRDGGIGGLDPSDTAMRFTSGRKTRVVASNRVEICIPRFAAARAEIGPGGVHTNRTAEAHHRSQPLATIGTRMGTSSTRGTDRLAGMIGTTRISGLESRTGASAISQWSGRPAGLSSIKGVAVLAQARGVEEITTYRGQALLLEKSLDPMHVDGIGDVVTVTLRFTNPTTEEMTDVLIADNLTTRLEYVDGTAKSSRPATFTTTANSVGSVVLRWAIDGSLKPGETGRITFQVRVK